MMYGCIQNIKKKGNRVFYLFKHHTSIFMKTKTLHKCRGNYDYASVSEMQIDWVLKNIFNCPENEIFGMKTSFLSEGDYGSYYLDGFYYYCLYGIGDPFLIIQIEDIQTSGDKYQVTWSLRRYEDNTIEKFYSAVVSRKIIEGKAYWSLYSQKEVWEVEAFAN